MKTLLLSYYARKAILRLSLPISDAKFQSDFNGVFSFSIGRFLLILQLHFVWKALVVLNLDWINLRTRNWVASGFVKPTLISQWWAIRNVLLLYRLRKAFLRLRFPITDPKFHSESDGVFSFSIRCFLPTLQLKFVWKASNVRNLDWINLRTLQLDLSR
jgi:hypothetical protein